MSGPAFAALLASLFLLAVIGGGLGWMFLRQRRETEALAREVKNLQGAVNAMLAGASGVDRRIAAAEQRLHELRRAYEDLQEVQNVSRPYDDAIRLVRQGATAQRLVEELGLTRSEAELLITLHGTPPDDKPQ
jgi:N-glycosylase/DNA lyase